MGFFTPPVAKNLVPSGDIDSTYKKYRLLVFIGIFLGYAGYYLVRKNFSLAIPFLVGTEFTKADLGFALSFNATAYGISKFIMGGFSDRSNAQRFLSLGLVLASLATIFAGTQLGTSSIVTMAAFQFAIGWFGGMGWPPCGRVMAHWFSVKERGVKMSLWNVSHNVGGGLIAPIVAFGTGHAVAFGYTEGVDDWKFGVFVLPAIFAIVVSIISYFLIRDTPTAVGLPIIEEYNNDYPENYTKDSEKTLSFKEIFVKYVLNNKVLWYVAFANAFVYFIRYGVLDWAPTYLKEVKGFNIKESGWAYAAFEWAAIPGTILCGWISDKVFKGNRSITTMLYMFLVLIAIIVYWKNGDNKTIDIIALLMIGALIYGPVMLIGVHALDLAPKSAAGASAGLTGFFGYFIGTSLLANILMGKVVTDYGWDAGFEMMIVSCILAMVFMALTLKQESKIKNNKINK